MYKKVVKRILDIVLSFIGILLTAIPLCIFALIIKAEDHGPAFFKQVRAGKDRKPFKMLKLRSMRMDTPHYVASRELENPEKYILKCGRWMRRFSIDELPQLINVFMGDMSVIGPRPIILEEGNVLDERDKYGANTVRPGITGWAQINGRDSLGAEEKAKLDGEYVEKLSFSMDCKCLFLTVGKVLKHENVVEGRQW